MNVKQIAATLEKHNGTWDAWGWICRGCEAGEEFGPVSDPTVRFGERSRDGLLRHQAEVIANG